MFANSAIGSAAKFRNPSYQCLACNRLWIFRESLGYQAQLPLKRAA